MFEGPPTAVEARRRVVPATARGAPGSTGSRRPTRRPIGEAGFRGALTGAAGRFAALTCGVGASAKRPKRVGTLRPQPQDDSPGARVPEVADAARASSRSPTRRCSSSSPASPSSSAPTAPASRTSSTRSRGCSARRDRARCRGGKMDDVIFAGTPGRPALGRAEVSLTIDNSARICSRSSSPRSRSPARCSARGESEYQLNGAPCRLLDIQELLSDTGIGRQQHVIVGQGQLDTVLNARPEDRRGDHRGGRRRPEVPQAPERAERRLESTEGNLLRLNDLAARGPAPAHAAASARPTPPGVTTGSRPSCAPSASTSPGTRSPVCRRASSGCATATTELAATRDGRVRARLRELDTAVIDAEHALTVDRRRRRRRRARAGRVDARARARVARTRRPRSGAASNASSPPPPTKASSRRSSPTSMPCAASSPRWSAPRPVSGRAVRDRGGRERSRRRPRHARSRRGLDHAQALGEADVRRRAADERLACRRVRRRRAPGAGRRPRRRPRRAARRRRGRLAGADAGCDRRARRPPRDRSRGRAGGRRRARRRDPRGRGRRHCRPPRGRARRRRATRRRCSSSWTRPPTTRWRRRSSPRARARCADLVRCTHTDLAGALAPPPGADRAGRRRGGERALEVATADPGVVAVTRDGDRFGGDGPWRLAGESAPQVTPAALAAAVEEATAAERRRAEAEAERAAADAALSTVRSRVHDAQEERLTRSADLERRSLEVGTRRRDLEVRAAALEERRSASLAGSARSRAAWPAATPRRRKPRSATGRALADRQVAYVELDGRMRSHLEQVDALHDRLRERRASAVGVGDARRVSSSTRCGASGRSSSSSWPRPASACGRSEIDDAETRMRLETAIERLRTEFDVRARRRARRAQARGARGHDARRSGPRARARAAAHGPDQPARARGARGTVGAARRSCSSSSTT